MTKETRDLFTALLDTYETEPTSKIKLKEIRSRFGAEVKQTLTFEEAKVENMPKALRKGDYAPFMADLEFNNVKFVDMFSVR